MLDEGAVKEIAENMRKIVDGGSEEMKKAMENFNQLQEKMANFQDEIDNSKATANTANFELDHRLTQRYTELQKFKDWQEDQVNQAKNLSQELTDFKTEIQNAKTKRDSDQVSEINTFETTIANARKEALTTAESEWKTLKTQ